MEINITHFLSWFFFIINNIIILKNNKKFNQISNIRIILMKLMRIKVSLNNNSTFKKKNLK